MVGLIKLLSTIATAFVLSIIYHMLEFEGILSYIAYLLCVIYISDKVSMHYISKYLAKKQAEKMHEVIYGALKNFTEEDKDE